MARGKKTILNYAEKIGLTPPKGLPPEVEDAWSRLRSRLDKAGTTVAAADLEMLTMAACQLARVEAMRRLGATTPITQKDERGVTRLHPLWPELRAAETQLRASFTSLMLTPRSRKGRRGDETPRGPVEGEARDPILRLLDS